MSTQTITSAELQAPISVPISVEASIEYSKSKDKYADYLVYISGRQPPLEEFKHQDPGLRADPRKAALLGAAGAQFKDVSPAIGAEVHGLKLSQLTSQQRDELALLTAERGAVIFRDQDFKDIGFERQENFAAHFGKLHVHQRGSHVKDHPYLLPVYGDFGAGARDQETENHVSNIKWHSDMTYEV